MSCLTLYPLRLCKAHGPSADSGLQRSECCIFLETRLDAESCPCCSFCHHHRVYRGRQLDFDQRGLMQSHSKLFLIAMPSFSCAVMKLQKAATSFGKWKGASEGLWQLYIVLMTCRALSHLGCLASSKAHSTFQSLPRPGAAG